MPLYELINGTFVPYVSSVNSSSFSDIICIYDPPPVPAYLFLCCLDLVAYLIPCLTRSTHPALRAVLFALNVALFANIAFDIYVNPSYGIRWLFISTVACLGVAFYSLAKSWALFITLIVLLGMAYWNAQDFSQVFFDKMFGVDLSAQTVNLLLVLSEALVVGIAILASNLVIFEWLVDAIVFSVLAVFAGQYLYFLRIDHSVDAWLGSGFMPDPTQLCCDDVYVQCPIWFTGTSIFSVAVLAFVRVALLVTYEDAVEEAEKAGIVVGAGTKKKLLLPR